MSDASVGKNSRWTPVDCRLPKFGYVPDLVQCHNQDAIQSKEGMSDENSQFKQVLCSGAFRDFDERKLMSFSFEEVPNIAGENCISQTEYKCG